METHDQPTISGEHHCTLEEILAADSLASDWTEQEVLAFIALCFDRDVLLKVLLGYASNWLSTRMITVITKAGLQPFLLEGWPDFFTPENDLQYVRSLRAPYQPPAPGNATLTIEPVETSGIQTLFNVLDLPAPHMLAVQPVQVGTRTALLLLGRPIDSDADLSSLTNAANAVGNQLVEIISHAKAGTLPPGEQRIAALPRPLPTPRASAVVIEELTSSLITLSETISNPIDDGWLDLLEDPQPFEPQVVQQETQQPQDQPTPTPHPRDYPSESRNPAHTLEMFPDALLLNLYVGTPEKTIPQDVKASDLSEAKPAIPSSPAQAPLEKEPLEKEEYPQTTHTLEMFIGEGDLSEPILENLANKTILGGFEAKTNVTPEPETPELVAQEPVAQETQTPEPVTEEQAVPDSRVLKRSPIAPKSFDTLKQEEAHAPKATPIETTPADSATPQEPEPPPFDIDAFRKAFPGPLLVDRYQHTVQTMPPVPRHGPLLSELVEIGAPALDLIREFINSSSIELRFYAVLLLTEMPVHNMLPDVVERLFDRDQQIRTIAQKIVLNARLEPSFERVVVQRMRHELTANYEEIRVEVAAEFIGALQDAQSIPLLITALGEHRIRIQLILQQALTILTFQDLAPSISEWSRWWQTAQHQNRTIWLIDALNSPSETIRYAAHHQTQQIPGLNLNYHPDQPQKLRTRAQQDLANWFASF